MTPAQPLHLGIVLFPDVEELDAIGPWEVLAWWTRSTRWWWRWGSGRRGGPRPAGPWKGVARYYHLSIDGAQLRDAAWCYRHPLPFARRCHRHEAALERRHPGHDPATTRATGRGRFETSPRQAGRGGGARPGLG